MSEKKFKILLDSYLNDTITEEELPLLLDYLRQYKNDLELRDTIQKALVDNRFEGISDRNKSDIIFQKIMQQVIITETPVLLLDNDADTYNTTHRKKVPLIKWLSAAAVLIIAVTGAYYFLSQKNKDTKIVAIKKTTNVIEGDVGPGSNKAILKLADGSTVELDAAANGTITTQGNTSVQKLTSGELAYNTIDQKISIPLYNTISTPRGGQYNVTLPDGSKVWLNAESSLYFPTSFSAKERIVTLTGEAYFEIAHNKDVPFKVHVDDMDIEVLGTHFNVNNYNNENLSHTTLLEGKVRVYFNENKKTGLQLVPGQQATRKKHTDIFGVEKVDVDAVTAWKNGKFQFNGDDIQSIMRQIERWFDVDVYYAGKVPDGHYSGTIGRDNNLLKVLKIFEAGDLKFRIEGKKLIVL